MSIPDGFTDSTAIGYLKRDVAGYPWLTAAEEVRLSQEMHTDVTVPDTANDIEGAVAKDVINPDVARNELILRAAPFVFKLATKMPNTVDTSVADLVQEGFLGLEHATRGFDPEKGFRFSTYAVPWVHNYMSRALHWSGVIRIAEGASKELKAAMDLVEGDIDMLPSSIRQNFDLRHTVSLFSADDHGTELADRVADKFAADPADIPEGFEGIEHILGLLSEEESRVLMARFYGDPEGNMSFSKIAKRLKLKPADVSRLLKTSLEKLRTLAMTDQDLLDSIF